MSESKPVVITAFAESASGPGWGNSPIRVIEYHPQQGKYTERFIQPTEQTEEMRMLYGVCQAAHLAMTAAVRRSR